MVQVPNNIQPALKLLSKYHFWLLALLMPLVLVPLAFTADATLINQIDLRRTEVSGKLDAVAKLARAEATGFEQLGHPQKQWAAKIDQMTDGLRQQIYQQWSAFWQQQQDLRVWPPELRGDFIGAVTRLKPGDKLATRFIDRYQNTVRQLVRKLPARLDAAEEMRESDAFGGRDGGQRFVQGPETGMLGGELADQHTVIWDPTDQTELYASFNWQEPPSTAQILLAQEELWCYETLCDAIAAANAEATGAHNATIASISQLAVGYRAAQSSSSGRGGGRVQRLQSAVGGMMGMGMEGSMDMGMDMGMDGAETLGAPSNPRFSSGGQMTGMGFEDGFPGDEFGGDAEADDDALRNWIYTDANGTPLLAEEIEASPDTKFAHLMPFVVRGQVDQRKLDLLLRTLATWPVPMNVREVRINPENSLGSGTSNRRMMAGGMGENYGMEGTQTGGSYRGYDVTVELRGLIALAAPPNREFLGLSDPTTESVDQPAEE
jgi:hypothetical protein